MNERLKRKQRAIKEFDFSDYDFSDCVEITGDALYLINGGAEIEIVSRNKYLR